MKKTYIAPETQVLRVNTQSMISQSPQFTIDGDSSNQVSGSSALSRGNSGWDIWDDDELE